ncbi:MAG: NUDIX hydrolase [Planctomycetales bacterium]
MDQENEILLETSIFRVIRKQEVLKNGVIKTREVIQHPGAVAIVPLVDKDRVCLIDNVRSAVGETLIEIPAGTLEANEDPQIAAVRELGEETGYRAGHIETLCQCFMSPGFLKERLHLFLATDLVPGQMALEDGEQITTRVVACSEALQMVRDGRIHDAKTIVGLLYYEQFRSS